MVKQLLTVAIFLHIVVTISYAQSKEEKVVADVVEQLRKAMINADKVQLERITSAKLSYGHSSGFVEGKAEFVEKILNGKSDFVAIDLKDQTISISDRTAIVRHRLDASTNDSGKPGEAHLLVLLVFQKDKGQWKLLARQAVKAPM